MKFTWQNPYVQKLFEEGLIGKPEDYADSRVLKEIVENKYGYYKSVTGQHVISRYWGDRSTGEITHRPVAVCTSFEAALAAGRLMSGVVLHERQARDEL